MTNNVNNFNLQFFMYDVILLALKREEKKLIKLFGKNSNFIGIERVHLTQNKIKKMKEEHTKLIKIKNQIKN